MNIGSGSQFFRHDIGPRTVLWLCQRADVTASVAASRGRPQPWRKADRGTAPIAVAAGLGISEEGGLLGARSVR